MTPSLEGVWVGTRGGAPGTGPSAASPSPAHTHARGVSHVAVGTHTHSKDPPCAPRGVVPEHPVPVPLTPVCPPQHCLSEIEVLAIIFAAAIHDYEHTGTTNSFHIQTK